MSFAKTTIVGNLGGDVETRYLESGKLVVSFSIAAAGRKRGNETSTTWFRVSAFGEIAERVLTMAEAGYIGKGKQLYVEGMLEAREYQVNGQARTSLDVDMTDWRFLGGGQQPAQNGQRETVDVGF